jgi:hypothetical protein
MAIMTGAKGNWVRTSNGGHGWAAPTPPGPGEVVVAEKTVTPNYTMLKMAQGSWMLHEIECWCAATGAGKRVNAKSFAFKTEADLMMFILRWNPTMP